MKIAKPDQQKRLFELEPRIVCTTNASARNLYGTFAQKVVCSALGLQEIPINGKANICPDAAFGKSLYEVKSVRQNDKAVIYDFRIAKEREVDLEEGGHFTMCSLFTT